MVLNPPVCAMITTSFNGHRVEVMPETPLALWEGIDYLPREEELRDWGRHHWQDVIKNTYHPFVQDEMIKMKRKGGKEHAC